MIEIRELVIRVTVTDEPVDAGRAGVAQRLAELKSELLEACDERIEAALLRGVER